MLLVPESDNAGSSKLAEVVASKNAESEVGDSPPPPPYAAAGSSSPPTSESPEKIIIKVPDLKPTNYVYISAETTSKGTYVLDPTLRVPDSLLPTLSPEEGDRKNFSLRTRNGAVMADLYLVNPQTPEGTSLPSVATRATISVRTKNGPVSVKLHRVDSSTPRFHLDAFTKNGPITVRIPRSYHGPIHVTTHHGPVRFSDALDADLVSVGASKFLGEFSDYARDTWMGDEATIETKNGPVKVCYDDEPEGPSPLTKIARLFSRWS